MPKEKSPESKEPHKLVKIGLDPIYIISLIIIVILMPILIMYVIPRIKESRRIRDYSSASEECAALGIDITRTSSPIIYIDTGITPAPVGMYASYSVTNNRELPLETVQIAAENFQGPSVDLSPNEDGYKTIEILSPGESTTVFYYLKASQESDVPESHDISIYGSSAIEGAEPLCSTRFSLTTQETIKANANKVNSVTYSPPVPEIGGTLVMQIAGETGVMGHDRVFAFTPLSRENWPADVFELTSAEIRLTGGNSGTYENTLFLNELNSPNSDYTITYEFNVRDTLDSSVPISPQSYISSGQRIKHTNTQSSEYETLPPTQKPRNITVIKTKSAKPPTLTGSGIITFEVEIQNTGLVGTELDSIRDILPDTPDTTSYISGSSDIDGSPLQDPEINGNTLEWTGPFAIPAGGTTFLCYDVSVSDTEGIYTNTVTAAIGENQIDTTPELGDDVPAKADVVVTLVSSPPDTEETTPDEEIEPDESIPEDQDQTPEAEQEEDEAQEEESSEDQTAQEEESHGDESTDEIQETGDNVTATTSASPGTTNTKENSSDEGDIAQTPDSTPQKETERSATETTQQNQIYTTTEPTQADSVASISDSLRLATSQEKLILFTTFVVGTTSMLSALLLFVAKPLKPMGLSIEDSDMKDSEKHEVAQKVCADYYKTQDISIVEDTSPKS